MFLSTGEVSVTQLCAESGRQRYKGDTLRMIDVPARIGGAKGIFDQLPKGKSSDALVKKLEAAAAANYGHGGRRFIRRYLKGRASADLEIAKFMSEFYDHISVADGEEKRFATRFALCYAAANLAIKYKILPWDRQRLLQAITLCYENAVSVRPDAAKSLVQAVARIKTKLLSGEGILDLSRKAPVNSTKLEAAGGFVRRPKADGVEFTAVKRATLERWTRGKVNMHALGQELIKQKALLTQSRHLPTKQVAIEGLSKKASYYCFKRPFYRP